MISGIIMGVLGTWQIIVILLVVLLLFGGKKIPELMKGLGKGIKEFKDGMSGDADNQNDKDRDKPESRP
ncbi:MAG: twin-arginine translocase TatA/TatE family subunit [Lentimicrobiaceae bacterium]|nr:twin-arginine translocase TatA/TatE family subunit [Lentimicrobiaceae bacterium]